MFATHLESVRLHQHAKRHFRRHMLQTSGHHAIHIVISKHVHARIQAEFTNKLTNVHVLDIDHHARIRKRNRPVLHTRPPKAIHAPLLYHVKSIRRAQRSKPFEKAHTFQMKRHANIARVIRQNRSSVRPRKRPRHLSQRDIGKIEHHRPRRILRTNTFM